MPDATAAYFLWCHVEMLFAECSEIGAGRYSELLGDFDECFASVDDFAVNEMRFASSNPSMGRGVECVLEMAFECA